MSNWLLPLSDLSPDQLRVVKMPMTEGHRAVFGPPGSGKTIVLVHRAAYLRATHSVPEHRFRMLVFTNVLTDYIRSGLEMVDIPVAAVSTFDRWCWDRYMENISRRVPRVPGTREYDFTAIHSAVLDLLQRRKDVAGCFDFVLVDEGQDLTPLAFRILKLAAHHLTVFADQRQQIFEGGASEEQILDSLELRNRNASFLSDYRNSPDVANLAAYFISDPARRAEYLRQANNMQVMRERPLCYVANSAEQELDRLAETIKQRLMMNQRVAIIVPQNRHVFGFKKALAERGIDVEIATGIRQAGQRVAPADFANTVPKIMSYYNAKGLTFDCVLLPRLTETSFGRKKGKARERLLFVGLARATQWVYMSTLANASLSEYRILEQAASNRHLVIQLDSQGGGLFSGGSSNEPEPDDEEDDDYSIL